MLDRRLCSRLLLAAAVLALPFTGGGCGRTACFTWSSIEGACPAQADALVFFSDPKCPGKVTSVDSEGTPMQDGALCCYAVSEREQSNESSCTGFGGASSSESVGQGGSSSFVAATSVGQGGSTTCARCGDVLGSASPALLCGDAAGPLKELVFCACGGGCSAQCADSFCAGTPITDACVVCLGGLAECSMQFAACANDV